MVGTHLMYSEQIDGLDNLCAFLTAVCRGLEPDTALEKYDLMPKQTMAEVKAVRNVEIIRLRKQGIYYKDIAKQVGCSKGAAFKVCKKAGVAG